MKSFLGEMELAPVALGFRHRPFRARFGALGAAYVNFRSKLCCSRQHSHDIF